MVKVKPKKVFTPGSQPNNASPGRGRPPKKSTMPKKKRGPRLQYDQDNIRKAIQAVKSKEMTLGQAAKHYNVPKTTIYDRMHSSSGKLGRRTELSEEEESIILSRLKIMGLWGFPLTSLDLRHLIKAYLDGLGKHSFRL